MTVTVRVIPDGSITSVQGFEAAGVAAGIKESGKLDLALVRSIKPCVGAAVFTTNLFKAAPVVYDQQAILSNPTTQQGVVINSGCANACTGEAGLRDAEGMAAAMAQLLGGAPRTIWSCRPALSARCCRWTACWKGLPVV